MIYLLESSFRLSDSSHNIRGNQFRKVLPKSHSHRLSRKTFAKKFVKIVFEVASGRRWPPQATMEYVLNSSALFISLLLFILIYFLIENISNIMNERKKYNHTLVFDFQILAIIFTSSDLQIYNNVQIIQIIHHAIKISIKR